MRKTVVILTISCVVFTLLLVTGCGKTPAAKEELALFKFIPEKASGVFCAKIEEALKLEILKKKSDELKADMAAPNEGKIFKDYQDFMEQTGIDLEKDIHKAAVAFFGTNVNDIKSGKGLDILVVLDLSYNREKFLNLLKEKLEEKKKEYNTEAYKDVPILTIKDDNNNEKVLAFINDHTLAAGKSETIRQSVDLFKGEGKNILDSDKMKSFAKVLGKGEIVSFAFVIPEELKKVHDIFGMLQADLSKAEIVFGFIDYAKSTWSGEFNLVSHNAEANALLVSTLNGTLGAARLASPEAGELVDSITFTSSADVIKLKFSISENLAEKMQERIGGKKPGLTPPSKN